MSAHSFGQREHWLQAAILPVMATRLAGLGDKRELELLVEAGFSVPEAVRVYTLNGAQLLGKEQEIGSIAPRKQADLVFLKGDLTKDVNAIEKPELVFKTASVMTRSGFTRVFAVLLACVESVKSELDLADIVRNAQIVGHQSKLRGCRSWLIFQMADHSLAIRNVNATLFVIN